MPLHRRHPVGARAPLGVLRPLGHQRLHAEPADVEEVARHGADVVRVGADDGVGDGALVLGALGALARLREGRGLAGGEDGLDVVFIVVVV